MEQMPQRKELKGRDEKEFEEIRLHEWVRFYWHGKIIICP